MKTLSDRPADDERKGDRAEPKVGKLLKVLAYKKFILI